MSPSKSERPVDGRGAGGAVHVVIADDTDVAPGFDGVRYQALEAFVRLAAWCMQQLMGHFRTGWSRWTC